MKKSYKTILSLLICLHLFYAISSPNQNSFLYSRLSDFYFKYGSTLGIAYSWQFFSPDPAPAVWYEYETYKDQELIDKSKYPDPNEKFFFRPNYNRRHAVKNVFNRNQEYSLEVLGKFICRKKPGIDRVLVRKEILGVPNLEEARAGMALNTDEKKSYEPVGEYYCDRGIPLEDLDLDVLEEL